MVPFDLQPRVLSVPLGPRDSAIVLSDGRGDGAQALIERIEEEIPGLVEGCYVESVPLAEIARLSPYFLLIQEDVVVPPQLVRSIRGLVLRQQTGWFPEFNGRDAVEWALYRHRANRIGSTIRLVTGESTGDPMLSRGAATIPEDATPHNCVMRAKRLGIELMVDVVRDALTSDELLMFDAPTPAATTTGRLGVVRRAVMAASFLQGWLAREASESRRY